MLNGQPSRLQSIQWQVGMAETSREQFPRNILVANVTSMSLKCHEVIGRVGRVGRGCYEDASDLSATNRACRARRIWRTTRHTEKNGQHYTATDLRPTNQVSVCDKLNGKVARHARHARHPRSIFARMSRMSGVSTRTSQGCYTRMLRGNFRRGNYRLDSTYGLVAELLDAAVEHGAFARRHGHVLSVRLDEHRPLRSTSGHVT